MRYVDASVLAKAYLLEPGSEQVRAWLAQGGCATARLSEIEVTSALARRAREDRALGGRLALLRNELTRDLEAMVVVELVADVVALATDLLFRVPLRAGDAIQLASALGLRDGLPEQACFVCADDRLAAAAVHAGLGVERVESGTNRKQGVHRRDVRTRS